MQIFVIKDGAIETTENNIDVIHTERTLRSFAEVDQDLSKAKPLALFKCKIRKYRDTFTVKTLNS